MNRFSSYINEVRRYDHLSEEEQLKAIEQDPSNVRYITNPSEEVQLAVVSFI
jgi:hypothetical protein